MSDFKFIDNICNHSIFSTTGKIPVGAKKVPVSTEDCKALIDSGQAAIHSDEKDELVASKNATVKLTDTKSRK